MLILNKIIIINNNDKITFIKVKIIKKQLLG